LLLSRSIYTTTVIYTNTVSMPSHGIIVEERSRSRSRGRSRSRSGSRSRSRSRGSSRSRSHSADRGHDSEGRWENREAPEKDRDEMDVAEDDYESGHPSYGGSHTDASMAGRMDDDEYRSSARYSSKSKYDGPYRSRDYDTGPMDSHTDDSYYDYDGSYDAHHLRERDSHRRSDRRRDSHRRSRSGRSSRRSDRRSRSASPIRQKRQAEPPSPGTQRAMWKEHEGAQRAKGHDKPSAKTAALLRSKPKPHGKPRSEDDIDADDLAHTDWQIELMTSRKIDKENAGGDIGMPYHRRLILPSSELPSSLCLPECHSDWQAPTTPQQFYRNDKISDLERFRKATRGETVTLGENSYTRGSTVMPPQITSGDDYYTCSNRCADFLYQSGRWTRTDVTNHRAHVQHVMSLFKKHPGMHLDIMKYDDDFRFKRFRRQCSDWHIVDDELMQTCIRDKITDRAARAAASAATDQRGGGASKREAARAAKAAAAAARGAAPVSPGNLTRTRNASRPCFKIESTGGVSICKNWQWGGCSEPCNHFLMDENDDKQAEPFVHKCSFCEGDHRVQDCDDYKAAHPADFALGANKRKGRSRG